MTARTEVVESLVERKYLRSLIQRYPTRPVVLIGSWARRSQMAPTSDLDVLVLSDSAPDPGPLMVQTITVPPTEFRDRLVAGDDFPQWALRYGIPFSGRKEWNELRAEMLPIAPWPDPRRSLERALRRLRTAQTLLEMGDLPAASEETLFALSHVARATLLAHRVFPLSRPELPGQLGLIGDERLRDAAQRMLEPRRDLGQRELTAILNLIEDRVEQPAAAFGD